MGKWSPPPSPEGAVALEFYPPIQPVVLAPPTQGNAGLEAEEPTSESDEEVGYIPLPLQGPSHPPVPVVQVVNHEVHQDHEVALWLHPGLPDHPAVVALMNQPNPRTIEQIQQAVAGQFEVEEDRPSPEREITRRTYHEFQEVKHQHKMPEVSGELIDHSD